MISIRNLHKSFDGKPVLQGIDAEISRGEVIAIIGPSGAGKSTLLRCLNLLETPDRGEILINGAKLLEPGADVSRIRRNMNMVFQNFCLFDHLNVRDNLTLAPRKLRGMSEADALATARRLLNLVGLPDKAEQMPAQLSGGQKQRIAIARCLAMDPEVILFDEPTSALDPTNVGEVLAVIKRLTSAGLTMLVVTHELNFARDVAARVFFMDEGGIYEEGPPEQLFNHPQREHTRSFIQQIRSLNMEVNGSTPDVYGLHGAISAFCQKQFLTANLCNRLQVISEELLMLIKAAAAEPGPVSVRVELAQASKQLSLRVRFAGHIPDLLEPRPESELPLQLIDSMSQSVRHTRRPDDQQIDVELKD